MLSEEKLSQAGPKKSIGKQSFYSNTSYDFQKQPPEVFCKKGVLKNFTKVTGKHLFQSLFFKSQACNFIKKETLALVFSCEFCEISKNTYFYSTPPVAASGFLI